jgi:hypothetical protein
MATVLDALVPLASVLLVQVSRTGSTSANGGAPTGDDLFTQAIAAVAVADASKSYLREVARPAYLSEQQYQELLASVARSAVENHLGRATEAREAIARVIPYRPELREYYQDAQAVTDQMGEILRAL